MSVNLGSIKRQTETNMQTAADSKRQTPADGWTPPRGIRIIEIPGRPLPWGCQWRVTGQRKTKSFASRSKAETFARSLAGEVKREGVAAYRLNEDEAREWRAFRATIGEGTDLRAVAAHWLSTGIREGVKVKTAADDYLAAKRAELLSDGFLSHAEKWIGRFVDDYGEKDAASITREDVAEWVKSLDCAPATRGGHLSRVRGMFAWLVSGRKLSVNPCAGIKAPKLIAKEVGIYTVPQGCALFAKNAREPRELLGRLALEAFAGLRFSSAAQITADEIRFDTRGIVLPADKIKTERREYIDGLPENLWAWLSWSDPKTWKMTPRAYLEAKSNARIRADLPEVHNALRHSFCSYHISAYKDASRTSVILCHSSPRMLWKHYRGNATEADGRAWFQIVPLAP
jgi:hypothetical protein